MFSVNSGFDPDFIGQNYDRLFFLISGSSKNVVINFGQEIQLLNDKKRLT